MLSWLTLFLLAFIWGSSFILMELALFDENKNPTISPLMVALYRLVISGLVLLPFSLTSIFKIRQKDLFWIALVGIFGNGIPGFLFPMAQTNLASAFTGMLNSLTPFFTFLLALIVFRMKVRWMQVLGLAIGLVGTVGLIGVESGFQGNFSIGYSLLVVLATICYAISVSIIHFKLKEVNPVHIASIALLMMGVPSLIAVLVTDNVRPILEVPAIQTSFMYIVILAIFGTALSLILFNKLVQKTDSIFASSVTYIIPIFAAMWGIYFGEDIGIWHLLFGAIIIGGVYLVNRKR